MEGMRELGLTQPRVPGPATGKRDGEAEAPIPAGASAQPGGCGDGAPDDQCLQRCSPYAASPPERSSCFHSPQPTRFLWSQRHALPPLRARGLHTHPRPRMFHLPCDCSLILQSQSPLPTPPPLLSHPPGWLCSGGWRMLLPNGADYLLTTSSSRRDGRHGVLHPEAGHLHPKWGQC